MTWWDLVRGGLRRDRGRRDVVTSRRPRAHRFGFTQVACRREPQWTADLPVQRQDGR
ncbi:hypothetical protein [Micromonospora chersina]